MKKILSLTAKDFEQGYTSGALHVKNGLIYSGVRFAMHTADEGIIRFSAEPVELGAGVVVGAIQRFAFSGSDAYANDDSGNIYKIEDFAGTGTVTKPKTGLTNTYGLEVFQTQNSDKYLYYFQKTQIGRMKISDGTFTDNWKAITTAYRSDVNPTLRIDDELYFGSGNVLSKIADNGSTDTELYENQLDLPKDYIITALETDGTYIIITASKSLASGFDSAETKVYFWDYKNILPSWTLSYNIQDPQIKSLKQIDGITYAGGTRGIYAFSFGNEPKIVRMDVNGSNGYGNMSRFRDAIAFGSSVHVVTYGKLRPSMPTALFKPFQTEQSVMALDTHSSNSYGLIGGTSKIYRQALNTAATDANGCAFRTGRIDLGDAHDIQRIDVVLSSALAANDVFLTQIQANAGNSTFSATEFSTLGGLSVVKLYPTAGNVIADNIALSITGIYGRPLFKQIDIYGERAER